MIELSSIIPDFLVIPSYYLIIFHSLKELPFIELNGGEEEEEERRRRRNFRDILVSSTFL